MVIPGQVVSWIDKCQQNIEKIQSADRIDADYFRQQYVILATITKVADGNAYFAGTQYIFPTTKN